jgi:hypothetical protein
MSEIALTFGIGLPIFIGLMYLGWCIHQAGIYIARSISESKWK